jgi:hypothetical protein
MRRRRRTIRQSVGVGEAIDAQGTETSISEAFYSPTRNSCVCEVTTLGGGGKTGIVSMLTLYDCLTREDLGNTLIAIGGPDSQQRSDEWKSKKDALRRTSAQ